MGHESILCLMKQLEGHKMLPWPSAGGGHGQTSVVVNDETDVLWHCHHNLRRNRHVFGGIPPLLRAISSICSDERPQYHLCCFGNRALLTVPRL